MSTKVSVAKRSVAGAPPAHLRIMTFNIRAATHLDGLNCWWFRRGLVSDLLREEAPDIIGFQEVMRIQLRGLRRALRGYDHTIGVGTGSRLGPRCYNPVFWRRDRVRVLESGGFWLSESQHRFSASWGAKAARAATWLRATTSLGGLVLLNVHLDHESALARWRGVAMAQERIRRLCTHGEHAVLLGDFNANAGSALHSRLLEAELVDTFDHAARVADADTLDDHTYHGFTGRRCPPDGRIDWVLCSPSLSPVTCRIVAYAKPPRYPSDHYPVVAELEAPESAAKETTSS